MPLLRHLRSVKLALPGLVFALTGRFGARSRTVLCCRGRLVVGLLLLVRAPPLRAAPLEQVAVAHAA